MSCNQNEKHSATALVLLKSNLGYYSADIPQEVESYLESLLDYAFDAFARMGIALKPGVQKDDMDQMIYAAWMYRNGVNGNGKNEMLKSIIRNRQVSNALCNEEETP